MIEFNVEHIRIWMSLHTEIGPDAVDDAQYLYSSWWTFMFANYGSVPIISRSKFYKALNELHKIEVITARRIVIGMRRNVKSLSPY